MTEVATDGGPTTGAGGPTAGRVIRREAAVRWRLSRHSRRLLTLALAALLLAVLNRRPELAGLAAPALLLLGAGGRFGPGAGHGAQAGGSRPKKVAMRLATSGTRLFEGEPA